MALLFAPCVPVRTPQYSFAVSSSSFRPRNPHCSNSKHRRSRAIAVAAAAAAGEESYDVLIIGSGLGGLSAGAVLSAAYGLSVCVLESHTIAGGAAHAFTRRTAEGVFVFDSGPSLFSGISGRASSNPLKHVLRAAGVDLPVVKYDAWGCFFEGDFVLAPLSRSQPLFSGLMAAAGGAGAQADIARLVSALRPLGEAATAIPAAALRVGDAFGSARAAARYLRPDLLALLPVYPALPRPFAPLLRKCVRDEFAYDFVDLLCFLLAGVGARDIVTAEVAFMFAEWTGASAGDPAEDALLEFPRGGSGAIVDALVAAIEHSSTRSAVRLGTPVRRILVENGTAVGVETARGQRLRARRCVMSNASVWDTAKLLPASAVRFARRVKVTPKLDSFVHLHLALDLRGSPVDGAQLQLNYIFVEEWARGIEAPQNVVVLCVPTVADPALAPPGFAVVHAYTPATEPYGLYAGMSRNSEEYRALKRERCEVLWRAVERLVPDARERAHVILEGTPLTHERFLSVDRGTYGPRVSARDGMFPAPAVEDVDRLLCIGQSTFPGIGVPAVAASGFAAANSLVPVEKQLALLRRIGL